MDIEKGIIIGILLGLLLSLFIFIVYGEFLHDQCERELSNKNEPQNKICKTQFVSVVINNKEGK